MLAYVGPIVISLVVAGLLVWLVNAFLPIDAKFKQLITAVVLIGAVLYILAAFGLFDGYGGVPHRAVAAPVCRPC